jgi:hypothetical protein
MASAVSRTTRRSASHRTGFRLHGVLHRKINYLLSYFPSSIMSKDHLVEPSISVRTFCSNDDNREYCWLTTITLDTATAFDTTVACYWLSMKSYEVYSSFESRYKRSNLLTSPSVMSCEERFWKFSVLQRVHLSSLVITSSYKKGVCLLLHRRVRKYDIEKLCPLNVYKF